MNKVALVVLNEHDGGQILVKQVFIFEGPEKGPLWDDAREYRDELWRQTGYSVFDATILNVSEVRDD